MLLHALIDGELDAGHARELEIHISTCAGCAARLREFHELRKMMTPAGLRLSEPASLRASIESKLPKAIADASSRRAVIKGFAVGATMSALAASGLLVMVMRTDDQKRILGEVVSAHLRSLQAQHLTDVASTDQHTVKPWFNGKLDLAPPVPDLTAQGFTLIGGRLDFLDAKPVAALVYRRRAHVINVFVGQDLGAAPAAPELQVMQGFNLLRWDEGGLSALAVSDLNRDELEEFASKFRAGERAPAG